MLVVASEVVDQFERWSQRSDRPASDFVRLPRRAALVESRTWRFPVCTMNLGPGSTSFSQFEMAVALLVKMPQTPSTPLGGSPAS